MHWVLEKWSLCVLHSLPWAEGILVFLWFLGGLSLHLNHLIAECMSAHYWQFGTLPIGIFLSNLVSGQLGDISYDILLLLLKFVNFWWLQGRLKYFGQNWVSSENQSFLGEGATGLQCDFGVLGSQITRLYDGTIFEGFHTLKGVPWAIEKNETEKIHFSAHLRRL